MYEGSQAIPRLAKFRKRTKRFLESEVNEQEHTSFRNWLASNRESKNSQQTDLPSSQIVSKQSLIRWDIPQLFAVIDTCSLVRFRPSFIDYIVQQKRLFDKGSCPIRIIISLPVLEELDNCNRRKPKKKRGGGANGKVKNEPDQSNTKTKGKQTTSTSSPTTIDLRQNNGNSKDNINTSTNTASSAADDDNNQDKNKVGEPPRMFMRFIEEEMRSSEILIGDLDPQKKLGLKQREQTFEILNKDDRILDCCLRARSFINNNPHHPETNVILITEDNVFKSKATTYEVVSYRWQEFKLKYRNFGLTNYTSTPVVLNNNSSIRGFGGGGVIGAASSGFTKPKRLSTVSANALAAQRAYRVRMNRVLSGKVTKIGSVVVESDQVGEQAANNNNNNHHHHHGACRERDRSVELIKEVINLD